MDEISPTRQRLGSARARSAAGQKCRTLERPCAKVGCTSPATATLLFEYATATAWLHDLTSEPNAAGYDLCAAHSERLTVPRGWDRIDRRSSALPLFVPRSGVLPESGVAS